MKKIIIWTGVLIIGLSIAYGIFEFNRGAISIEKMEIEETISANELMLKFQENETMANENFLDKVLLVKGEVMKTEEKDGKKSIFLSTNDSFGNIICQLENYDDELPGLGEVISVKGLCTGYLMDVVLIKSKIV